MPSFAPRQYQVEAVDAIAASYAGGHNSTLVSMATGTGKTATALYWLRNEYLAGRVTRALWIAHRRELILQPQEYIQKFWRDDFPEPGVVMAKHNHVAGSFVFASIQTLYHRVDDLLAHGNFSHVIYDETHHIVAKSNLAVVRKIQTTGTRLLGLTATPNRTDKSGLVQVFDDVSYRVSIFDAIYKWNCLVPLRPIAAQIPVDILEFESRSENGYQMERVGGVLAADNVNEIILEKWREHAGDRQTIAFTANVAQAFIMAKYFSAHGVSAVAIEANTPKSERQQILKDYQSGQVQVICNCNILTEGFDAPETECVLMAKPTKSDLVYVQSIGRGLRLAPGKTDCVILDFEPQGGRDLIGAGDILGEPIAVRKARKKAEKDGVVLSVFDFLSEKRGIDTDPDSVVMTAMDLFGRSELAFTFDGAIGTLGIGPETIAITLPQHERIAGVGDVPEKFRTQYEVCDGFGVFRIINRPKLLGIFDQYDDALYFAQNYATGWGGRGVLTKRGKAWRRHEPTPNQIQYAKKLGCWQDGMTKGQVAQAITHQLAMSALRRGGWIK